MQDKVIRDGKVAVLYSPGFGAGWFSSNNDERLLFDPILVKLVEEGKGSTEEFEQRCKELNPAAYLGAADDLEIKWVPQGTRFEIDEYDGSENVRYLSPDDGIIA